MMRAYELGHFNFLIVKCQLDICNLMPTGLDHARKSFPKCAIVALINGEHKLAIISFIYILGNTLIF